MKLRIIISGSLHSRIFKCQIFLNILDLELTIPIKIWPSFLGEENAENSVLYPRINSFQHLSLLLPTNIPIVTYDPGKYWELQVLANTKTLKRA